ncbi:outer membrane lipoprotein LolB [Seongchinamella unica]|uniref:Outer-membrane lipoprotein LolB n=1 Tax=Seongchinamella unica TaxID=2547392 RepID=A0A4R5LPG2_9GAMM|nr:lipoprotein insertase outer membrane protein LolB [Seongchinamella unica]TDG12398.1 outer membrane lipoprotein LolB [Seongchinamella unica]
MAWLLLLAMSGCAGLPGPAPGEQSWQRHREQLQQLSHWTASGKIALRTPDQAESASLLWQQMGESSHLRLSGPMGISATTVDSDGRLLEVRQGEDYSRWDLDDPGLGAEHTWDLPVRSLHHWLKGIPAPEAPVESLLLDEAGQLPQQLQQSGWTIDYQQFSSFGDYLLPTRLQLSRGATKARIILREWGDLSAP